MRYFNHKNITVLLFSVFAIFISCTDSSLESKIQDYTKGIKAEIGVAVIIDGKDTLTVNNDNRYPLMSVFKLHQALSVGNRLNAQSITPEKNIFVTKDDLKENTYSPLRDKYPDGEINISIDKLLDYTLKLSDNNACDILFKYISDTKETDNYIRGLGIEDFSISQTEDDMHKDLKNSYKNWSTPLEMSRLMEILFTKDMNIGNYQDIIKEKLLSCRTGENRLPYPLKGTKAQIAHKTGTGDTNEDGAIIGINDAGYVLLPDGRRYAITVFVKDSYETFERTEQIIADISQMVYDYMISR